MIKSFRHAGLKKFFDTGSKAGIQPDQAKRLARQLAALDDAKNPLEMNVSGWHLHPLKADRAGHWSIRVSGNWRMIFTFDGEDAILVDYDDYH